MPCAVPSCAGTEEDHLVPFPQNVTLQSRWKRAIEAGTGLRVPTYNCGALCSWHFGDQLADSASTGDYWEPHRFLHMNGKTVIVAGCRFCLRFADKDKMSSDEKILGNGDLVVAIKQLLRIYLKQNDILNHVCETCDVRMDVLDSLIKSSRHTVKEYQALETATKKSMFCRVERNALGAANAKFSASGLEIECMNEEDDPEAMEEDRNPIDFPEDDETKRETEAEPVDIKPVIADMNSDGFILENMAPGAMVEVEEQVIWPKPVIPIVKKQYPPNVLESKPSFKQIDQVFVGQEMNDSDSECPMEEEASPAEAALAGQVPGKRGPKFRPKPEQQETKPTYRDILSRKCHICDTVLDSPEDLMAHLTQRHTATKAPYKCVGCDVSFKQIISYNRHMGFHDQTNRPLKCCYCPMGFKTQHSLLNHENRQHGASHPIPKKEKPKERNFKCEKCDQAFRTNYDLLDHDRYHHQGLPGATCKLCGKHFRNRPSLRKHHLTHTGDKPYDCQQCDAVFRSTTNLVAHVARCHEPEATQESSTSSSSTAGGKAKRGKKATTSVECDVCSVKFPSKKALIAHIESLHLGNISPNK